MFFNILRLGQEANEGGVGWGGGGGLDVSSEMGVLLLMV